MAKVQWKVSFKKNTRKNPIKWTLTTYVNTLAQTHTEREKRTINALNEFNNEHGIVCNRRDQEETMSKA